MLATRRMSRTRRVSRILTGVIAVWCLGCSAFDPIIGLLAGADASAVMLCGADEVRPVTGPQSGPAIPSVSAASDATQPMSVCDCQSCCAPAPISLMLAADRSTSPRIDPADIVAPLSLARQPLVPPPQRIA